MGGLWGVCRVPVCLGGRVEFQPTLFIRCQQMRIPVSKSSPLCTTYLCSLCIFYLHLSLVSRSLLWRLLKNPSASTSLGQRVGVGEDGVCSPEIQRWHPSCRSWQEFIIHSLIHSVFQPYLSSSLSLTDALHVPLGPQIRETRTRSLPSWAESLEGAVPMYSEALCYMPAGVRWGSRCGQRQS